jgi:diguanylate cyclase (GGDEF)-like protein
VAIEEVVVDRRIVAGDRGITAPPGSRDIEIHYTGLSLVDPQGLRFRYHLSGYDPDWVEAGSRRVAYYGRVPPGRYEFRVEAALRDGSWTGGVVRLPLRVQPRVIEMLWFRAGVAVMLVAALAGWLRLRARQQQLRETELRQLVTARTADLERANRQLSDLTTRDDLTGIANHRGFRQTLEQEWLRCQRRREPLSLLICDIDEFKAYNDGYGHPAGDACLIRIATAIAEGGRRGQDLAARYGGEEFAVVLPATDAVGAHAVGTSIRNAVAQLRLPHAYSKVATHVTISVGCATLSIDARSELDALLLMADQALYEAKHNGRDRVVSSITDLGAPS